ncbi:nucleotidyltransferase domain-containing protein [Thermodesulfovibrio sp. TK110]
MITEDLIEQIKNKIVENFEPEKIIIFGSQATGEATEGSDIDLVIIMKTDENPYRRNLLVRRIFSNRKFSIDVFVFTPEEEEKFRNVKGTIINTAFSKGKILYERR